MACRDRGWIRATVTLRPFIAHQHNAGTWQAPDGLASAVAPGGVENGETGADTVIARQRQCRSSLYVLSVLDYTCRAGDLPPVIAAGRIQWKNYYDMVLRSHEWIMNGGKYYINDHKFL